MAYRVWGTVGMIGLLGAMLTGCVSAEKHERLQVQNRRLQAEKVAIEQELQDERTVNNALRERADSLQDELDTKDELVGNYRRENDRLDDMLATAENALGEMANRETLPPITLTGTKLPEELDDALQRFASMHADEVAYDPAAGTMKWKADLLFALGSDVVRDQSKSALRDFASVIESDAASDFEVLIVGHTDDKRISNPATKAKHPSNWHLSAHRAISVARVLLDSGYAPQRIAVAGCGEYRPIADNSTVTGASQNRRVEIYLMPRGSISSKQAMVPIDRDHAMTQR